MEMLDCVYELPRDPLFLQYIIKTTQDDTKGWIYINYGIQK